jgi:hypothetical protein
MREKNSLGLDAGWPDEFVKKITQNEAQHTFCRNWCPNMWATYVIFQRTGQTKKLPIGRKFTQSGHPGWMPRCPNKNRSFSGRVTRLVEFSPVGWLFTLGVFWKLLKYHKFWGFLFHGWSYALTLSRNLSGFIFGDFFRKLIKTVARV